MRKKDKESEKKRKKIRNQKKLREIERMKERGQAGKDREREERKNVGIENVRTKYQDIAQNLVLTPYFLNPLSAGVTVTQTDRQTDRQTCIQTNRRTERHPDRQIKRHTDTRTNKQTDRQKDIINRSRASQYK